VERRKRTVRLADIYDYAGYKEYAERAGSCATWLQFNEMFDGSKTLGAANFCQLRLCPMCAARRAKKAVFIVNKVMDEVQRKHGVRYIFLTLTIRNVPGDKLSEALGLLTKGWYRLMDQCAIERAVKGWYRAIETTRNRHDDTFHPHIHAILAVPPEYLVQDSPLYITHDEWVLRWRKAARLDYDPRVDVRVTYARHGRDSAGEHGRDAASMSATLEAAKYATKDKDFIDPKLSMSKAAEIVTVYTEALRRRRLTAFGGLLKDAARRLKMPNPEDDTDLVHIDDEHIRDDVADLITTYKWHFGAGDYILASRELNPLKVIRVDPATGEVIS